MSDAAKIIICFVISLAMAVLIGYKAGYEHGEMYGREHRSASNVRCYDKPDANGRTVPYGYTSCSIEKEPVITYATKSKICTDKEQPGMRNYLCGRDFDQCCSILDNLQSFK